MILKAPLKCLDCGSNLSIKSITASWELIEIRWFCNICKMDEEASHGKTDDCSIRIRDF